MKRKICYVAKISRQRLKAVWLYQISRLKATGYRVLGFQSGSPGFLPLAVWLPAYGAKSIHDLCNTASKIRRAVPCFPYRLIIQL